MAGNDASPSVSQLEARELAGKSWQINGDMLRFADFDPREPGQPPWKTGAEGIAYPLHGANKTPRAYVKFFDELKVNAKRIGRTRWLIKQQMGQWLPGLAGAPGVWVDTSSDGQPHGVTFHFACSLAKAVPGRTWLEAKLDIADGVIRLDEELRKRCVMDLIRGLVHLEQRDIVHGDLSPNNIIVDVDAAAGEPALYLIDFDGFVAPAAGRDLYRLTAAEGGTFGTKGYCPPDLERQCSNNNLSVAPYSDRYARDMLLLELLCYDDTCDFEEPVCEWPVQQVHSRLDRSPLAGQFAPLRRPDIFTIAEKHRPSTESLAEALAVRYPPRVKRADECVRGYPGFNAPAPVSFAESLLTRGIQLLWLSCVALLGLLCVLGADWLGGSGSGAGQSALLLPVKLLMGGGVFIAGLTGLTVLAFATDRARMVNVLGWWFQIPPRQQNARSEIENQIRAVGMLVGITFALGVCIVILQKLR